LKVVATAFKEHGAYAPEVGATTLHPNPGTAERRRALLPFTYVNTLNRKDFGLSVVSCVYERLRGAATKCAPEARWRKRVEAP